MCPLEVELSDSFHKCTIKGQGNSQKLQKDCSVPLSKSQASASNWWNPSCKGDWQMETLAFQPFQIDLSSTLLTSQQHLTQMNIPSFWKPPSLVSMAQNSPGFPPTFLDLCSLSLLQLFIPYPFFFLNLFILFIYFWLRWVFIAVLRLSLVVASGGYSSLWQAGFSLQWLLIAEHKLYARGLQ